MARDTVSEALLQIRASTSQLRGDLQRSEGILRTGLRGLQGLTRTLAPVLSIAGIAGTAGVVAQLKSLVDQGDRLGKLSQQLSTSAEDLDKLRQVAELSGSDLESAGRGMFQLATAVEAAERSSTGRTAEAFGALNIDLKEFRQLNPIEQLEAFAKGMAGIENPTQRAEAAAAVLGNRIAKELLPTLDSLANDGLANVVAVMDDDFADASERFKDNLAKVGVALERVRVDILGPFVSGLNQLFAAMNVGAVDAAMRVEILEKRLESLTRGGIANRMARPFLETLFGQTAEEIELELIDLKMRIDELGGSAANLGGGGSTPAGTGTGAGRGARTTAAATPIDEVAARIGLEQDRAGTSEAAARIGLEQGRFLPEAFDEEFESLLEGLDLAIDRGAELDDVWASIGGRIGDASLSLVDDLLRGTLDWRDALGLVLREAQAVLDTLARANGGSFGGGGGGSIAGTVIGAIGGLAGSISPLDIGDYSGVLQAGFRVSHSGGPILPALTSREVPILAEAGEFMLRKEAVARLGLPMLEAMNTTGRMPQLRMPRFHDGGLVSPEAVPGILKGAPGGQESGGDRKPDVRVNINGPLIDPRSYKSTPGEIVQVFVDSTEYSEPLRNAIVKVNSRSGGGF